MLAFVFTVALLFAPAASAPNDVKSDPFSNRAIVKVVEMLEVLGQQIDKEGHEEKEDYDEYSHHHYEDVHQSEHIIKDNKDKIDRLTAELKEAEAFRQGKKIEHEDLANALSRNSADLTKSRATRKKERALFQKNAATFAESIDQLERAIIVVNKKAPAAAAASSASLISVAEQLKKTLSRNSDFSLNPAQQETLNSFLQAAYVLGDSRNSEGEVMQAPSFLQNKAHQHGDFESKTGGLLATLTELQTKVTKEQEEQRNAEKESQRIFKDFETDLVTEIESANKSMEDIKTSIMQSQQESSQNEATLLEAKQIFDAETEHLDSIRTEFRKNCADYKIRLGQRMDEMIAVHDAQRMMKKEIEQAYLKRHDYITSDGDLHSGASLLQLLLKKHAARRHIQSSGLAFLALKSAVKRSDPFRKVKSMIQGMLEKLLDTQAKESEHAAWCDKETGKTTLEQKRKINDVQKTKDRLEALAAQLTATKAEIEEVTKNLADMKESFAQANGLRHKEHKRAKFIIAQFKDGAVMLKRAVKILKSFYEAKAASPEDKHTRGHEGVASAERRGYSTGIIAILEIAVNDFDKSHSEASDAEDTAAEDFEKLESETNIRTAVFDKSLEYNTRTKVKLEYDESTMKNDLKSYEKELANINNYMDQLQNQCTIKSSSYAERKAKREAELASLKEALTVIQSRDA